MALAVFGRAISAVEKKAESGTEKIRALNDATAEFAESDALRRLEEFKGTNSIEGSAFGLLEQFADLLEQQRAGRGGVTHGVESARQGASEFFNRFIAQKFGSFESLLRDLMDQRKREAEVAARQNANRSSSSGTLSTTPPTSTTVSVSAKIQRIVFGLP